MPKIAGQANPNHDFPAFAAYSHITLGSQCAPVTVTTSPRGQILTRMTLGPYWNLQVDRHDQIFVLTMQKAPENRINVRYAQEIIRALRDIEREIGTNSEGAVIIKGNDEKFWCTGLDLDEVEANPHANSDGFFPVNSDLHLF